METYRNQNLQGKSFVLEEVAFVNCQLHDCDLYYSGGDFDWFGTNFEACRFHWKGPAKNTVTLLQAMGALKPPQMPPQSSMPMPDQSQKLN
jgi:hypothetical protein